MKKILTIALILMLAAFGFICINSCIGSSNDDDSGSSGELYVYAPSNLVVTATSSGTAIIMSWTDNSDNEIGFRVEHSTPSVTTWTPIATISTTVNSVVYATHTGLALNTTHYYRVRAFNYTNDSDYSNVAGTLTSWDTTLADGTAPTSRTNHTTLWAPPYGMIIWGGWDGGKTLNTGAVYSPTVNTWPTIITTTGPSSRTGHSAIWTGTEMIVWGGYTVESSATQTIDNCESSSTWASNSSEITTTINSVITKQGTSSVSLDIASVFTTGLMAYYNLPAPLNISARTKVSFYLRASQNIQPGVLSFVMAVTPTCATTVEDLTINTTLNAGAWTLVTLNLSNPALLTDVKSIGLKAISDPGAVTILIDQIEASGGGTTYYNDGGIYYPLTNTWTSIATTNAPDARAFHSAVWTGSVMIVWGGKASSSFKTGGVYDPVFNEWRTGSQLDNLRNGSHANTPSARSKHTAFWTGSGTESWRNKMIIWGGDGGGSSGGIYDIFYDIWIPMASTNAPSERWGFSSVWTVPITSTTNSWNNKLIVWGGYNGSSPLDNGAIYDPAANTWTTMPATNAPSARMYHSGIWTGNKMFIWGGDSTSPSGGIYDPVYSSWGPITTVFAPSSRLSHTGVWTGAEMIIWGGFNGISYFNSGGRYKAE